MPEERASIKTRWLQCKPKQAAIAQGYGELYAQESNFASWAKKQWRPKGVKLKFTSEWRETVHSRESSQVAIHCGDKQPEKELETTLGCCKD